MPSLRAVPTLRRWDPCPSLEFYQLSVRLYHSTHIITTNRLRKSVRKPTVRVVHDMILSQLKKEKVGWTPLKNGGVQRGRCIEGRPKPWLLAVMRSYDLMQQHCKRFLYQRVILPFIKAWRLRWLPSPGDTVERCPGAGGHRNAKNFECVERNGKKIWIESND